MEMNMDQKQKQISGSRFNIFDFLIIVGVIVCLAAIAARILFIGNEKKKVVYADVYFEISGISDVTADAIGIPNESIYFDVAVQDGHIVLQCEEEDMFFQ